MLGEGGNLFYQERDKDLLKVGGENVSATEVEDDRRAPSPASGRSPSSASSHEFLSEVVVAFVITAPGAPDRRPCSRRRSSRPCRAQLADFKVPRAVYVVDEFPTGTLDKILKNKLREMADERPPVE